MINYLIMAFVGLALPVIMHFAAKMKPNPFVGVRLPATYADPAVWSRTNQKGAQIVYTLGPAMSIASLLFYFTGTPPERGGTYLGLGLIVAVILMTAYLYFYSKTLLQKTLSQPGTTTIPAMENVGASKAAVILFLMMGISFVVLGILEIYSHAGTSIGIRVGNVFRDAATWHKVNTVGGIGDIVVGGFFTFYFAQFIPGVKNPKRFYRAVFSFIAAIILWTIVSAIYAYRA